MYKCILCRYHEIATKGNNRFMFENKLMNNIRLLAEYDNIADLTVQRIRGRVFVRKLHNAPIEHDEMEKIKNMLSRCFGLESFSPVLECEAVPEILFEKAVACASAHLDELLQKQKVVRFRTRARRSDKTFPLISRDIEIEMASRLHRIYDDRIKVDLDHPELTIGIEVREKSALIFHETFKGPGGLPVGTNSDVLAMLSGGIDSPVACHMTMKRGCHVDFLTFHSFPYTPEESLEKVKRIASVLNRYQKKGRLFACNLAPVQKLIRDHCNPRHRTILYRRMMMRIATMVCHFHKLHGIVTGDSIGQVASQTIVNMSIINDATSMLMIRPLVGMDKLESIDRAMKIGTFDLSIIDVPDSCTVFAPSSPAVAAKYDLVEEDEKKIPDLDKVLDEMFRSIERFDFL